MMCRFVSVYSHVTIKSRKCIQYYTIMYYIYDLYYTLYLTLHDTTLHHIKLRYMIVYYVVLYFTISQYITLDYIYIYIYVYHIESYHMRSYPFISYHIFILSYYPSMLSYHILSYHIIQSISNHINNISFSIHISIILQASRTSPRPKQRPRRPRLAGTRHRQLVLLRQLVHAQNGDDVLVTPVTPLTPMTRSRGLDSAPRNGQWSVVNDNVVIIIVVIIIVVIYI